ncbi:MAG: DUF401 family protein [Desulfovibrio sp.]|jgi:integral membrane protein (TIGR00529 family)|nr:DUF401 family protein [Desulfovibrio sp.]
MEPAGLACVKLLLIFAVIVLLMRRGAQLRIALLAASLCTALVSGIGPGQWPGVILATAADTDFLLLCFMIWMMITLSGVQAAGGQNTRLVDGLENHLHNPRIRLFIFPALVGLLPMPGGALFSCPMIKAVAGHMPVGESRQALINYWFRHIWETAWPLYPGYILASSLLGLSLGVICRYTFPLIFLAVGVGWFFFLRDIPSEGFCSERVSAPAHGAAPAQEKPLVSLLCNFLPIFVVLVGAALFTPLLDVLFPEAPKQTPFGLALCAAVGTAVVQNRGELRGRAAQLVFSADAGRIIILLFAVFLFKDLIAASGIVRDLSGHASGLPAVAAACLILPFVAGVLTGVMVGFVGLSFPVLLDLIRHAGLQEYTLPLVVLSLAAGNCGQMISPLHVCLVVTCEFFNTKLPRIWRSLVRPTAALFTGGALLAAVTAAAGARF